jgi:hypothetical protein
MNDAYRNFLRAAGAGEVSHVSLVDGSGNETAAGREAVTWDEVSGTPGLLRPTADIPFTGGTPSGTVAGWKGFSASTGGTDYGGATFAAPGEFDANGEFTLEASGTAIRHQAPS